MNQYHTCGGIRVTFRPMMPGEDHAVRDCLRDEYGETYHKKGYYEDGFFTALAQNGHMDTHLIETDSGKVIGFYLTKWDSGFPGQAELSTLVLQNAYRSFHITGPLFDDWLAKMDRAEISSYFGHMQVFHARVASKLYAHGLQPCGILLSMVVSERFRHSFGDSKAQKLPLAVAVKAVKERTPGLLHVPSRHAGFTRQVFDSLDVVYQLSDAILAPERARSDTRLIPYEEEASLFFFVEAVGRDLLARVRAVLAGNPSPLLTVNVLLNVRDPAAVWAFEQLAPLGFFAGYQPLARGADYMILHLPGQVPVSFDDFVPFEPWEPLVDHVRDEYRAWKERSVP